MRWIAIHDQRQLKQHLHHVTQNNV